MRNGFLKDRFYEDYATGAADQLCNGECPPNEVDLVGKGEKIRRGDKDHQLSYYTYDKAVNALAESLTG